MDSHKHNGIDKAKERDQISKDKIFWDMVEGRILVLYGAYIYQQPKVDSSQPSTSEEGGNNSNTRSFVIKPNAFMAISIDS